MKICLTAAALMLIVSACEVSRPAAASGTAPELSRFAVPDSVFLREPVFGPVTVAVTDPQGADDLRAVVLTLTSVDDPAVTAADTMNDEGRDGDTVAGDGLYSCLPSTALLRQQDGPYACAVTAEDGDGNLGDPLYASFFAVDAEANLPPYLFDAASPDTVSGNGLTRFTVTVRVSDNRGAADIDSVWFDLYSVHSLKKVMHGRLQDDGAEGDTAAGDSLFTFSGDVSATVIIAGRYRLRLQGIDRNGSLSNILVSDLHVDLPDGPPVIFNLSAPDTISRLDNEPFVITVQASDPMGLGDIEQVFFNVTVPGGGEAAGNPFAMYDDGTTGDETAGDGIYSLMVIINIENSTGDYRFDFQARDSAGALSNTLTHTITVVN